MDGYAQWYALLATHNAVYTLLLVGIGYQYGLYTVSLGMLYHGLYPLYTAYTPSSLDGPLDDG